MRGLDDYITGKNDPSAPFNQTDWTETFEEVLEKCPWITEEMLQDDKIGCQLGRIMEDVAGGLTPDDCYSEKLIQNFIKSNAEKIATLVKEQFEIEVELAQLLVDMDIPELRRELTYQNLTWLGRNLGFRNSLNTNYVSSITMIIKLLKKYNSYKP